MPITFSYHYSADLSTSVDEEKTRNWIKRIIKENNCRVGSIGYLFCDDDYLHEINIKYLSHDTFTDIITFDYVEGNMISGDIMISVDRVADNANTFGVSFEQELKRVIIHGILHLLGQNDKCEEDEKVMHHREDEALVLWQTVE